MDLKYYVRKIWYKGIYLIATIVYLVCLNKLNHVLLMQNFESSFKLLSYDNNIALKYFAVGVILFVIGCILLYQEGKKFMRGLEDFAEVIIGMATIIVVLILVILIIVFINNPILRAILVTISIILGAIETAAK